MGFARRQPSTGSGARRYEKMWGFAPVLFAFQDIFARNIFRKWKIEIYSSGQNGDGFLISLLSSIWVRPTRPTRGTPIVKKIQNTVRNPVFLALALGRWLRQSAFFAIGCVA